VDVDPRSLPEDTNPPIKRRVPTPLLLLCAFLLGGLAHASLPTPVSLRGHAALSARPSTHSLASPRQSAPGASDVSSNTTQSPAWPPGANGVPALATAVVVNLATPETERSPLNVLAAPLNNPLLNNALLNYPNCSTIRCSTIRESDRDRAPVLLIARSPACPKATVH
jgi:hypothetical protein